MLGHGSGADCILTVVTVVRNDAGRLMHTLESTEREISGELSVEHLIWDGGSTDESVAVAEQYCARVPGGRLLVDSDEGLYDAMNRAARAARGRFVYFLNCGDKLREGGLGPLVSALVATKRHWAVFNLERITDHGTVLQEVVPMAGWRLWFGNSAFNHQATVYDRAILLAIGAFDYEAFGFASDLVATLRFSVVGPPVEVDMAIAAYEGGGVSAELVQLMPRLLALAREDILQLSGGLAVANRLLAVLQTVRRRGIRGALRIWRQPLDGSFRYPHMRHANAS